MSEETQTCAKEGATMSRSRKMGRLTKELDQAAEFRKSAIDAMRRTTQATLTACASMRGETSRDYRARTQKFLASLVRDVAAHRRATAHQIAQTRRFLTSMAKDVAADRRATVNQLARFSSARRKAGSQMRGNLERQVTVVANKTAGIRDAAANAISEVANAHRRMARQQEAALRAGRRKLGADTARFVKAMHADRMKTHGIWSDFRLGRAA
jgi:hypothetical protein